MDVYLDEVDAVLSYLMMEIGWNCYRRHYPKKNEDEIESRRILRGKKSKKTKKNVRVAATSDHFPENAPIETTSIASLPHIPPLALNSCASVVKKRVPDKRKPRTTQAAKSTSTTNNIKSRWDKAHQL